MKIYCHKNRAHRRWIAVGLMGAFWTFLFSAAHAQSNYTPYTVSTLAGKAGYHGFLDGTNSTARFFFPTGVAVDTTGNVYVADTKLNAIRKVTPGGVVTTLAGGTLGSMDGTNGAAQFATPNDVAVDSAGNVYVADKGNSTIRKITPDGVVTTLAGLAGYTGGVDGTNSQARFYSPSGVAVDAAGDVYVADSGNSTIRKVTTDGVVTTVAGLAGHSGSADGTGGDARFNGPSGVAVDRLGNIYVADYYNFTIRKITGGSVTTLAGLTLQHGSADGTGSDARFNSPTDVAVDGAGNVYVADDNNSTLRKVTPGGVVTTLAGLAGVAGGADGTGNTARFYYPHGIAVDDAGTLYVADYNNHTIRKAWPLLILSEGGLTNQWFKFTLTGPADSDAVIDASTNLDSWTALTTNQLSGGMINFIDQSATNYTLRFYRARLK